MITVGQVTKPQGVRGEVKVRALTDDPSRFCVLKSAYVGGKLYRIENVRVSASDVYIKFAGVTDRTAAEALRGESVQIDRAAAISLSDGEFFIADLLGCTLVAEYADGAKEIGRIEHIQSFGAADVFTVSGKSGNGMTFAFVKGLNARLDEQSKTLTVDGNKLNEVAVYDED